MFRDVVSSLNLQHVFPRLKHGDVELHAAGVKVLLAEAKDEPTAQIYGKCDVLPLDTWSPRNME